MFAEDAQLTNAPTKLRKEEYVSNMVQSDRVRLAVMKDAPPMQRKEEYASVMEQR